MTKPGADLVTAADVRMIFDTVCDILDAPAADDASWDAPAGALEWTCRATVAHISDCGAWYAATLARRSPHMVETGEMSATATAPVLVDALRSGGALLAVVVGAAAPEDRGFHPFGIADRSGFAAMGCDEVIVHGADLAVGLGVDLDPPRDLCDRVVRRLFPWAPTDIDPWESLQWANGRIALGDREPAHRWRWHCAPLDEWDGKPRYTAR